MTQNNKLIRVPIPPSGTDLVEYFNDQLKTGFSGALDFDIVAQRGDRAVLDDQRITEVTVQGNEIEVEYEFEYSAYAGCRDMNWADGETSSVVGQRDCNDWVFDRHIPWEPRSSEEEF